MKDPCGVLREMLDRHPEMWQCLRGMATGAVPVPPPPLRTVEFFLDDKVGMAIDVLINDRPSYTPHNIHTSTGTHWSWEIPNCDTKINVWMHFSKNTKFFSVKLLDNVSGAVLGQKDINGTGGYFEASVDYVDGLNSYTLVFENITPPPPPPNMFTFTVMGPDDWDFRMSFSAMVDGWGMPCHFDLHESPPTCTVERGSGVRVEGHVSYGPKSYLVELCSADQSEVFDSATVVNGGMFLFGGIDYMVQPDVDFEFVLRVTEA